jgi:tetratricopeptide (TPR) repeat protein
LANTVGLILICRDNADTIAGPLQDARRSGCDSLTVVDTGSADHTCDVARSLGATVHHRGWIDDFSDARNYAVDMADADWLLHLDSIDRISDTLALYKFIMHDLPNVTADAVLIDVVNNIGPKGATATQVRLFRKSSGLRYRYPIHENIDCTGHNVTRLTDITIQHPRTNLKHSTARNVRMLARWYDDPNFHGRDQDYKQHIRLNYGRELIGHDEHERAVELLTDYINNGGQFDYWAHFYRALATQDNTGRMSRLRATTWLDESRAEAFVEIGMLLIKTGQYRQAVTALRHALACKRKLDGITYTPDYTWRPWCLLSVAYQSMGNERQAAACWDQALRNGWRMEDDDVAS